MGARRDPLLLRSSSGSAPAGRFVPRAPLMGSPWVVWPPVPFGFLTRTVARATAGVRSAASS